MLTILSIPWVLTKLSIGPTDDGQPGQVVEVKHSNRTTRSNAMLGVKTALSTSRPKNSLE
jgi:hypothetical protein